MQPAFQNELGTMLPEEMVFPHFAEREAAWLLHQQMTGPTRIADLRRSDRAPLVDRPGVREVVAACGDGQITPQRLAPLADPLAAFRRERELAVDGASRKAFDLAMAADWQNYSISFAEWGKLGDWREIQLSRQGANLVLQLNFPERYREAFLRHFEPEVRRQLEYYGHPVRFFGAITLAWARLDFEPWSDELLIEELQTDWLRSIKRWRKPLTSTGSMISRKERRAFIDRTLADYTKVWARVLMLAVLVFARRELGANRVWLHQPHTGARLKNIREVLPPRSLYTDLPRRFGFRPSDRAPEFLYRARHKALANLRRSGRPLFWRLDFPEVA